MICIGECFPPKSTFPFWDLITGNAPVNEYSILGYQMLLVAYFMFIFIIPLFIFVLYHGAKVVEEIIQRITDKQQGKNTTGSHIIAVIFSLAVIIAIWLFVPLVGSPLEYCNGDVYIENPSLCDAALVAHNITGYNSSTMFTNGNFKHVADFVNSAQGRQDCKRLCTGEWKR